MGADGQETQSGTVRGDSAGISVWGGDDPGSGEQVENTSPYGSAGAGQRDSAGTQEAGEKQSEVGAGAGVHRRDFAE